MINVLVWADSANELARLEALVSSAPSLHLAGSCLGRTGLSQLLADTQPDVLLERVTESDMQESLPFDPDAQIVPRILLVGGSRSPCWFPAIQEADSDVHAILPFRASNQEILAAIEAVAAGLIVWHPDLAGHAVAAAENLTGGPSASLRQQLSPRESQILNLLAAGLGNKEIAWQLKISDHTVKFHVASIFDKLDVSTRAEAVAVGIRRGLIAL